MLLVIGVMLLANATHAQPLQTTKAFFNCFTSVGQASGISPELLTAIARVESSLDPMAINNSHQKRTGSYDIGLMQINSRWLQSLSQFGIREKELYDPCVSIEVGAWILVDLFRRHGSSWEAVGAYNAACTQLSPQKCREARDTYISKVQRAMESKGAIGRTVEDLQDFRDRFVTLGKPIIQSISFQ